MRPQFQKKMNRSLQDELYQAYSAVVKQAKQNFTHFYELINDESIFIKTSGLILIFPVNG